jgi:hypothetical protein
MRAGTIQMVGTDGRPVHGHWWAAPRAEATRLLRRHGPALRLDARKLAALLDGDAWLVVVRLGEVSVADVGEEADARLIVGRLVAGLSPRIPGARQVPSVRAPASGTVAA